MRVMWGLGINSSSVADLVLDGHLSRALCTCPSISYFVRPPAFQASAKKLRYTLFKPAKKSWDKFVVSFMDYPITICTFCLCSPATQRQNWGQSPLTLMTNPTSIQKHVRNYVQHIIGCEMSHKLGAFHTDPQFPKDATQPFWTIRLL